MTDPLTACTNPLSAVLLVICVVLVAKEWRADPAGCWRRARLIVLCTAGLLLAAALLGLAGRVGLLGGCGLWC